MLKKRLGLNYFNRDLSDRITFFLIGWALLMVIGCSTGKQTIHEKYYLGASNGKNRVYYRVIITGETQLGVAKFHQGWFPASAVDALFGDVSEGAANKQTVREELRMQVDEALIKARKAYLEKAIDKETKPDELKKYLEVIRRVRLTPRDHDSMSQEAFVMEYHPNESLLVRHSDEKLVLILSSNPDEILTNLSSLAEGKKTEEMFTKFANVMAHNESKRRADELKQAKQSQAQIIALAQQNQQDNAMVSTLINSSVNKITKSGKNREITLGEIDALISAIGIIDKQEGSR